MLFRPRHKIFKLVQEVLDEAKVVWDIAWSPVASLHTLPARGI